MKVVRLHRQEEILGSMVLRRFDSVIYDYEVIVSWKVGLEAVILQRVMRNSNSSRKRRDYTLPKVIMDNYHYASYGLTRV